MTGSWPERPASLPATYRPLTVGAGVKAAALRLPEKIAVTFGDRSRSYAELSRRIDLLADATAGDLGLAKGDTVAIIARNCLEYIEIVCGVPEAGVAVATVNPRLSVAEIVAICDDCQARVLFVESDWAERLGQARFAGTPRIIELGPDYETWLAGAGNLQATLPLVEEWDAWTIPYTSGTTGKPKGVVLSHRARVLAFAGMAVAYGCFGPDDKFLAIAPLNHGGGMGFCMPCLFHGGEVEILDKFDAEATLAKLKFGGFTGIFTVPTHFQMIFALPPDTLSRYRHPPIKTIICNAAPLPQALKEKIVPFFGPTVLHECYGSTEAGVVTSLPPVDQLRKVNCVGLPFVNTLVEIRREDGSLCDAGEVGELWSQSATFFTGYWGRPEETRAAFQDGWISVGDLARRDDEGHIYIVDRKNDMVISGGVNIYPREIEDVLAHHPRVAAAAVIGVPDPIWGESLRAFVEIRQGPSFDLAELHGFCAARLAGYRDFPNSS